MSFYKGKKVLITGHTGFKGTWLCKVLLEAGANVVGYSAKLSTKPSLYKMLSIGNEIHSIEGDIRDYSSIKKTIDDTKPEIVFHLAAQPIVRKSYEDPAFTYETNVMGTVNLLDCIRRSDTVRSILNVTTDKVYLNQEWEWGYRENEILDGFDPYSNSKSCSELVTHCFKNSFFNQSGIAISTARAGNVIGGGDFAPDRIIPDCVRAALQNTEMIIRNPNSTRPYQHVLEPIMAYLMISAKQFEDTKYSGWYNVGPEDKDCIRTGELVKLFAECWGKGFSYSMTNDKGPHEATFLKLDCSKLKSVFEWTPRWGINTAIKKVVEWAKAYQNKEDVMICMSNQIKEYLSNAV